MKLFKKAENTQAYLKAGLMGFAGSGKTFTSSTLAIGLVKHMRQLGLEQGNKPVLFLDTETGSDWVQPMFDENGIELYTAKTRAFKDLIPAVLECEREGSVLIIDSISHFWKEFTESYAERKNRKYGLQFQDWAWLKQKWGQFTDLYVNSQTHIIMCGRAGYEFDFFEDESGKKQLEKTGVKMRAEVETGYEPSILVYMERAQEMSKIKRIAHILKDRSTRLDGKSIESPTFNDFLPHIEFLNLGGQQVGFDSRRTSKDMIEPNEKSQWQLDQQQRKIILDQVKELLTKHWPGATKEEKLAKADALERDFGTRSWVEIEETFDVPRLKNCYNTLHHQLEGAPAYMDAANESKQEEAA